MVKSLIASLLLLAATAASPFPIGEGVPKIFEVVKTATGMAVVYYAPATKYVELQASSDLAHWVTVSTNYTVLSAYIETNSYQCRFYRLKVVN